MTDQNRSSSHGIREEYFDTWFATAVPDIPARFGIVTAFNPHGRLRGADLNAEADARLESRLRALGRPFFRVRGESRDGQHQEPGFGVAADVESICTLAREFEQDAIFWVEDGVVYCTLVERLHLLRVALWTERMRSAKGFAR